MPEFDKNAVYIWACFVIGAVLIFGALLQAVIAARAAKRRLAALEAATESGAPE
jgi:heme exporter protein CcmD